MSRYACVADQKAAGFPVTTACEYAGVSTSGFYDWCAREYGGAERTPSRRGRTRRVDARDLRCLRRQLRRPRMHRELRRGGVVVNHKRVRRLLRRHGMAGRCIRRRVRTTFPGPDGFTIPDLVNRAFNPGRPDVAWCQDITYIATGEGWLYLASVLDLGSRRLLGYSMADHMRTELVLDALGMAIAARGGLVAGVIAHADRGSVPEHPVARRWHPLNPGHDGSPRTSATARSAVRTATSGANRASKTPSKADSARALGSGRRARACRTP